MTTDESNGRRGKSRKSPDTKTQRLTIVRRDGVSDAMLMAEASVGPAVNAASLIDAYHDDVFGGGAVEMDALVGTLKASMGKTHSGDLSELEDMLMGQATALQTMFVSLAKRAQAQQYQKNLEAFLGLALKAQAQSRATIQAIVELKYPRQATFVKQANIAHGPQQINNKTRHENDHLPRTLENQSEQIEVLEGVTHGRKEMDARATAAPAGGDSAVDAVAAVHRPQKRRR